MLLTLNRLNTLKKLSDHNFISELVSDYPLEQIDACCDMLKLRQIDTSRFVHQANIQRRLVEHPEDVAFYLELMSHGVSVNQINAWLAIEEETGCRLADYPADTLAHVFALDFPNMLARQEYVLYYMNSGLCESVLKAVHENICFFHQQRSLSLSQLTDAQRELLTHPFFSRCLLAGDMVDDLPLLEGNPLLVGFLDMLCEAEVGYEFCASELKRMDQLSSGAYHLLEKVYEALGNDADRMFNFLSVWQENGGHEGDVAPFLAKAGSLTHEQQDAALETRLSYLNLIYGGALGEIPFRQVPAFALPLLSYALARRQNVFLRMIAENFELFSVLSGDCPIFNHNFYSRTILNAMTLKNLLAYKKSKEENHGDAAISELDQRNYTFDELHALWEVPRHYGQLYQRLAIPRVDGRLLVLRQLLKHSLLPSDLNAGRLDSLAARLSEKPLFQWRDQEFKHIAGLDARQCVLLLASYDLISRFIPDIATEAEASFAIRQANSLSVYSRWSDVLNDIERLDTAWAALRGALELDDDFIQQNREHIIRFLLQEGASIAMDYANCLDKPEMEGFYRIVRAQLMGQYQTLKYFHDDLDREISRPISDIQKQRWTENLQQEAGGFEVCERDDFFTVMRIGEIPERTCLSYKDGAYRECLLACFDSNKKFLYATLNGKPVARAMLRLTKGRAKAVEIKQSQLEFADLRNQREASPAPLEDDDLALFLETPYTNGLNEDRAHQVRLMFIELAAQKARMLNAVPVLSPNYRSDAAEKGFTSMKYHLYISRSKAGKQYLDSLGGANTTSREAGSYKEGLFQLPARVRL